MKTLSSVCSNILHDMQNKKPILCHYVMAPMGPVLNEVFLSTEHVCEFCGKSDHFCPAVDPKKGKERMWLCANVNCSVYNQKTHVPSTYIAPPPMEIAQWPLFCEKSGIGDLYHELKFEDIDQSVKKVEFLFNFAKKPKGIVIMQGGCGSGKTFAAMGVCELFLRTQMSCIFLTHRQMRGFWLDSITDKSSNFVGRINNCNLLVVDDFGTAESSDNFLGLFLDVINTRAQWSNRGTILTTNLKDVDLTNYCGEALNDRIKTGQKIIFDNKTRRKKTF